MAVTKKTKSSIQDVRVPVLFVLDMSGSMLFGKNGKSKLDHLNEMIVYILKEFMKKPKVQKYAEIGFILFTHDIILESKFENIRWMSEDMMPSPDMRHEDCGTISWTTCKVDEYSEEIMVPQFGASRQDFGTDISKAVIAAVRKLEDRVAEVSQFGCYPPFMIMVTDGDPDYRHYGEAEQKAIRALRRHASTHRNENNLIFPFVIGIGAENEDMEQLERYVEHFRAGYYPVGDDPSVEDWQYIADILARSVSSSVSLNSYRFLDDILDSMD